MSALLDISGLGVHYGGIEAVARVDLTVHEGERVALIGANGAGKSSTLKAVAGLITPSSGRMLYDGTPLERLAVWQRASTGLCLVPEGRGVFPRLSIEENLLMGAWHRRQDAGIFGDMERIYGLFERLRERRSQPAGTLSGGEQQLLALGRALMSRPRLLMLDEPSMGLAPLMVEKVFDVIRSIAGSGVTLLLVEQNARLALELCDRVYVMESGKVVLTGKASDCLLDVRVREAYLGV